MRVSVVGTSGSGKSTFARELATRLGVPYVELDAIFHQPGWTELPREEFRARVEKVAAGGCWVVDGNYGAVRDLVWARADTVIWLDLARSLVAWQVVGRTVGRWVRREELWNGNRERLSAMLSLDPNKSVILWSLTRYGYNRRKFAVAPAHPDNAHLTWVRLRSRAAARHFLAGTDPPFR